MPSERAHVDLALHDIALINRLASMPEFSDWMSVAAFYAAVHVVEAVFSRRAAWPHGQTHDQRRRILTTEKTYENLYRHYRPLDTVARIARYLEADEPSSSAGKAGGVSVQTFNEYMPAAQVLSQVVQHHLVRLIRAACDRMKGSHFIERLRAAADGLGALRMEAGAAPQS